MEKINFENLPSTNTPINVNNLNQMQTNAENAIENLITTQDVASREGVAQIGGVLIQWGYLSGVTVPASGYTTYTINYKKEFKTIPAVCVTPLGNYNIIAQAKEVAKNYLSINVRSVDGYERTERTYHWCAIGT